MHMHIDSGCQRHWSHQSTNIKNVLFCVQVKGVVLWVAKKRGKENNSGALRQENIPHPLNRLKAIELWLMQLPVNCSMNIRRYVKWIYWIWWHKMPRRLNLNWDEYTTYIIVHFIILCIFPFLFSISIFAIAFIRRIRIWCCKLTFV